MRRSHVSLVALVLRVHPTPAGAQTTSWIHQFGTARSDRARFDRDGNQEWARQDPQGVRCSASGKETGP